MAPCWYASARSICAGPPAGGIPYCASSRIRDFAAYFTGTLPELRNYVAGRRKAFCNYLRKSRHELFLSSCLLFYFTSWSAAPSPVSFGQAGPKSICLFGCIIRVFHVCARPACLIPYLAVYPAARKLCREWDEQNRETDAAAQTAPTGAAPNPAARQYAGQWKQPQQLGNTRCKGRCLTLRRVQVCAASQFCTAKKHGGP